MHEILLLVKKDQENMQRYKEETTERWDEPKVRENPESIQTK
jgi:mannitol-1-phosphate/altronate dehydrogenase